MPKLYELSASELASLVAAGDISSREIIEAHLARIEEVNQHINAITVILEESALKAAELADKQAVKGPLHGVPFTIKESIDCKGSATTHGIPALKNALPKRDAPIVSRMKAAGAIPLARTNLPEFGLRLSTSNPLRGATLNPWNPGLTAGGSSGGDAAALATGMTPFGLGNDICGSLRSPAYCCGITALKPTLGRIARASSIKPFDFGIATQAMLVDGPMARSITDLKLGLSILAGRDIRDPRSVDAPLKGSKTPLKAALVTEMPDVTIPAITLAEIRRAGQILVDAGWEVEEVQPPKLALVTDTWGKLFSSDYAVLIPKLKPMLSPALFHNNMKLCQLFDTSKLANSDIHATRSKLIRLWSKFFQQYPVVIGPTWTQLPWPVDVDIDEKTGVELFLNTVKFLTPGNVLGLPSVSLPMGIADNLPTGIQIYADLWREDLCLEAAEIIETVANVLTPINPHVHS